MALCTVILHGKSAFAVVARPARSPFLHIGHGVAFSGCTGSEDPIVAVTATMERSMDPMAEGGNSRLAHSKCHIHC